MQKHDVDPSANDNIIIQEVVKSGEDEMVALFLNDARVDAGANNYCAIDGAVAYLNYTKTGCINAERLKLLLNNPKVNPVVNFITHIETAIHSENSDALVVLLKDERATNIQIPDNLIELSAGKGFHDVTWLMVSRKGIYNSYVEEMIGLLKNVTKEFSINESAEFRESKIKAITSTIEFIEAKLTLEKNLAQKKYMTFFSTGHQHLPQELMGIIAKDYVDVHKGPL